MSTPTLRDEELEQLFLPKVLYIGEQLPQTSDDKCKFVMLGTPKEFMDDIRALIATNYKSNSEILEARLDEVGKFLQVITSNDTSKLDSNEWLKIKPQIVMKYWADRLAELKALGLDKDVIEGSD